MPLDGGNTGGGEALVNTTAIDILRRLPGVTEANYRSLITAADSLAGQLLSVVCYLTFRAGCSRLRMPESWHSGSKDVG